jgi:tripartite-type tricarboxylate transporter receptor subunit TctC
MNRLILSLAVALAVSLGEVGTASSQLNFSTPIQIIVPFPAGGSMDTVARIVANGLSRQLGTEIVVLDMPGAQGLAAAQFVAQSEPSGRILLIASSASLICRYQAELTPVGMIAKGPILLFTSKQAVFDSAKDLVSQARSKRVSIAHVGPGATVALQKLEASAGITLNQIPLQNDNFAFAEIASSQIEGGIANYSGSVAAAIRQGVLKPVAIASRERSPLLPGVPTFSEQGFANVVNEQWIGMLAPARSPREAIEKLSDGLLSQSRTPEFASRIALLGLVPSPSSPSGFVASVNAAGGVPVCGDSCPSDCTDGCGNTKCCVLRY